MVDGTTTELIGVTIPTTWVKEIDELAKKRYMTNRQDIIREAIAKYLIRKEVKA
jgi:metal-responsive CopG/Arc/MetJ family transcriptional regulator